MLLVNYRQLPLYFEFRLALITSNNTNEILSINAKTWIFSHCFGPWICQHEIWWNGIDYGRFSHSSHKIDFFHTITMRLQNQSLLWSNRKEAFNLVECNRLYWFILKFTFIHFFVVNINSLCDWMCVCVWSKSDSIIYSWSTTYLNESFVAQKVWWFQYLRHSKPHTYLHKAFLSEWIDDCDVKVLVQTV